MHWITLIYTWVNFGPSQVSLLRPKSCGESVSEWMLNQHETKKVVNGWITIVSARHGPSILHIWRYPLTCLVHALLKQSLSSHSQPFLFHVDSTFTQIHFLHMTWDVAGWLGMDQNSLRYKSRLFNAFHRLRPHHVEYTGSRPITVVKQRRARSVLGWVTTWEYRVL